MSTQSTLNQARKMAERAKPHDMLKLHGDTYTFVFDYQRWVYSVYKNLIWFADYNTKKITTAKQWLRDYVAEQQQELETTNWIKLQSSSRAPT